MAISLENCGCPNGNCGRGLQGLGAFRPFSPSRAPIRAFTIPGLLRAAPSRVPLTRTFNRLSSRASSYAPLECPRVPLYPPPGYMHGRRADGCPALVPDPNYVAPGGLAGLGEATLIESITDHLDNLWNNISGEKANKASRDSALAMQQVQAERAIAEAQARSATLRTVVPWVAGGVVVLIGGLVLVKVLK